MTTVVPSQAELSGQASALVPLLQANASWTEENRRLHDKSVEAMADAGIFKLRTPARYGGYECDARTVVAVVSELARGDGSASWNAAVWSIATWMAGLFPDAAQDEVFASPDARVCGTLSPSAMAVRKNGGVVLNGKWGFISGALHSHWQITVAMAVNPDGSHEPIMALVPMSDLEVVDDWYTSGLSGTGSVTTIANEVYVPAERTLSMGMALHEQYASERNSGAPIYRSPMLPTASASSIGTALGLAKAARDLFFERLPDRGITYTSYASQREAPVTHLQVADASLKIDAAEFHIDRLATLVDAKGHSGEPWTIEERVRARVDMARACQLAKDAVETFSGASGASSLYRGVAMQRIERDIRAISMHALMHPTTNLELYGRILCGLEPNTLYV